MTVVTAGIDLAKSFFTVDGGGEAGKAELARPHVPCSKLLELVAHVSPCLIGMEACSGAHRWTRKFAEFGHTVRLMAPKCVAPYCMSGQAWQK